tara:strand:+ start:2185 stop:2631 length:447 start_codon:yes stop_codon:yes gene_type:complete
MEKKFHSSTLKKSIRISTSPEKAWTNISKIAQLQWLDGIKSSKFLSEKTRGIGATRRISFLDGTIVKEIVVGWRPKNYFSYIAVSGLPLRGYHATISIINKKNRQVDVEWESFFSSKLMTNDEFNSFFRRLSDFYTESLKNLKNSLEK